MTDVYASLHVSLIYDEKIHSQPFATYSRIQELTGSGTSAAAVVDGHSLSIADVVAVARHNVTAQASTSKVVRDRVDASVAFLER